MPSHSLRTLSSSLRHRVRRGRFAAGCTAFAALVIQLTACVDAPSTAPGASAAAVNTTAAGTPSALTAAAPAADSRVLAGTLAIAEVRGAQGIIISTADGARAVPSANGEFSLTVPTARTSMVVAMRGTDILALAVVTAADLRAGGIRLDASSTALALMALMPPGVPIAPEAAAAAIEALMQAPTLLGLADAVRRQTRQGGALGPNGELAAPVEAAMIAAAPAWLAAFEAPGTGIAAPNAPRQTPSSSTPPGLPITLTDPVDTDAPARSDLGSAFMATGAPLGMVAAPPSRSLSAMSAVEDLWTYRPWVEGTVGAFDVTPVSDPTLLLADG
jgi:hypothetical protein